MASTTAWDALNADTVYDALPITCSCRRCGAASWSPCVAVTVTDTRNVGDVIPHSHPARTWGTNRAFGKQPPTPRSRKPAPPIVFGDNPDLPDLHDLCKLRTARTSSLGRAVRVEAGSPPPRPVVLTAEQLDRFWSNTRVGSIHPTDPSLGRCIWWTGARTGHKKFRYGAFTVAGRRWSAHRLAFALANYEPTMHVLHTCDRPGCVNARHLYEGNSFDNTNDMLTRGRAKRRKKIRSDSGYRGVRRRSVGWSAAISVGRDTIQLGRFESAEEAARAYDRAANKYHAALYSADYPLYNFPEEWQ